MLWSDPARAGEFDSFIAGTKEIISKSILGEAELEMYQQQRTIQLNSRRISRKRLRPEIGILGITAEDAKQAIAMKLQKNQEIKKKKEKNIFMKLWRTERDEIYVKGVTARKTERDRVKRLKEMQKGLGAISVEMYEEIPDPEVL